VAARHLSILVVEDNTDTNEVLANLLRREGHVVTSVDDGRQAYNLASRNLYEVIICDIGLPNMSGYELVKNLRARTTCALPVFVALSGYNRAISTEQDKDKLFHYYLVKPIKFQAVKDVISAILNAREPE
jgi:CheY-like chemotaxis protein